MDCRLCAVVFLGLMGCLGGCSILGSDKTSAIKPDPIYAQADSSDDAKPLRKLSPRKPKASTCVAYGQQFEGEANHPNKSPTEQENLREQARKAYQQALDLEPKNLQASMALARLHSSRGDHGKAVAIYQKALKAHPKEKALYSELGMTHARQKEWEPALKNLRKAVELDPDNYQLSHHLGWCLARAGHYNESLICFKKTDGEAKAHFNLARMLLHMQQNDLSRQHLHIALEKNPQLVEAQQLLANLEHRGPVPQQHVPAVYQDNNQ